MQRVDVEKFIFSEKNVPILDVRSPSEFHEGHLPGAINIPVFNDEERALVGTTYKQIGKEEAIEQGLELVGPKMKNLGQTAKNLALDNKLKLYCWRGGMRSEKMAWLFELVGLDTFVLEDGYKAYRSYANQLLSNIEDLLVLQGPTGCGKTAILMALEEAGEQVIDLEGLANHKGSAFGGLGMSDQPTTQQFQNNIFAQLLSFDLNQRIWVESESMSIGKVYLPEALWLSMNDAKRVVINQSKENRLRRIVEEYGHFSPEKLKEKVVNLTQRLGGNNVKIVLEAIDNDNIMLAADALLNYYDKAYSFSAEKYKFSNPVCVDLTSYDPAENAKLLLEKLS